MSISGRECLHMCMSGREYLHMCMSGREVPSPFISNDRGESACLRERCLHPISVMIGERVHVWERGAFTLYES